MRRTTGLGQWFDYPDRTFVYRGDDECEFVFPLLSSTEFPELDGTHQGDQVPADLQQPLVQIGVDGVGV